MVMGQLSVPYQNPAGLSAGTAPGAAATASAGAGRPVRSAGPALLARTKIDARARTDARADATATRGRFIVLLAMGDAALHGMHLGGACPLLDGIEPWRCFQRSAAWRRDRQCFAWSIS